MDVLCPNCQKMLTLPDHHAGQMAKCPECNNVFTAPELPATPAAGYVPPPTPPPAPAAVVPAPPVAPVPHPFDGQGITPAPSAPAPPREPAVPPVSPSAPVSMAPAPTPSAAPAPAEYTHRWSAHANAHVLQALAVLAVLAVFVLSFFPWVGHYPGGVPVATQSAWQIAFGSETVDEEVKKLLPALGLGAASKAEETVSASGMMILFVLLLILTLLVTVAAGVWNVLPAALPARVQALKPWRWGIAAALLLLTLVFLLTQQVSGFNLEARTTAEVNKALEGQPKRVATAVERGIRLSQLHRTAALIWATLLNALALVCALLVFWVERRGSRPTPRVDLLW